ncbi:hypothetical protein [Prolixibacter sp. NT017]|uniref:hypothetical protein n=1 Tax=Prolixibacter sp. NT017 TaxID=2652390 RepID=UPI00128318C5|nr:hypothetical protein [Prolixibacter sp. NT017]GET27630.1 hypothetical protein NT017_39590 [Prolixibacter sp. NT017]
MTAEIGILNKTSIVLAADSAVTVGRVKKVFNNANKLFPLSKYEPIGIMVYNNASWMGIPFEIIIKSYTKHLAKKSFDTLVEYRDDFIKYIKDNYSAFVSSEQIKEFIEYRLYDMLYGTMEFCKKQFELKCKNTSSELSPADKDKMYEKTFFDILDRISSIKKNILPDFKEYKLQDFKNEFKSYIDKILPGFYTSYKLPRKAQYTSRIYKQLYHELICEFSDEEDYSGIVIAGYGNNEIFPSICNVKIGELVAGRLRYEYSEPSQVSQNSTAIVKPFAQRDMIDTFFQGINPDIIKELNRIIPVEFEEIIDKISNKYDNVNKADVRSFFKTGLKHINENLRKFAVETYIKPVMASVGFLRKEDLIELAESLINITSVKRKTSESLQSVGGPVDIAIITKHEGFVWVKRKDIIDRSLNSLFYSKELKEL